MAKLDLGEKIDSLLFQGASFTQAPNSDGSETGSYSTNYSPNNLKSVILSPEGMILTFHTTTGNQNKLVRRINFPQTEDTYIYMEEGKELLSFLVGKRVYSSVEEIILIAQSGYEPMFKLPKRQLSIIQTKIIQKLKRLKDVMVISEINTSLEEFQQYYEETLKQENSFLSDIPEIQSQQGVTIIPINKEWYKSISLRPAYYKLDDKDGELYRKFHRLKEVLDTGEEVIPEPEVEEVPLTPEQEVNIKEFKALCRFISDYEKSLTVIEQNLAKIDNLKPGMRDILTKLYKPKKKIFRFSRYFSNESIEMYPELGKLNTFIEKRLRDNAIPVGIEALTDHSINGDGFFSDFLVSYRKLIRFIYKSANQEENRAIKMVKEMVERGYTHLVEHSKENKDDTSVALLTGKDIDIFSKEVFNTALDLITLPFGNEKYQATSRPIDRSLLTHPEAFDMLLNVRPEMPSKQEFSITSFSYYFIGRSYKNFNKATDIEILMDYSMVVDRLSLGGTLAPLIPVDNPKLVLPKAEPEIRVSKMIEVFYPELIEGYKSDTETESDDLFENASSGFGDEPTVMESNSQPEVETSNPNAETLPGLEETPVDLLEQWNSLDTLPVQTDTDDDKLYNIEQEESEKEEQRIEEEAEKEVEELDKPWKPDNSVKQIIVWANKIKTDLVNVQGSSSKKLYDIVNESINDILEFIEDVEPETVDTELKDYVTTLLLGSLNELNDVGVRTYLALRKGYFENLKTVRPLNSNEVTFTNGFQYFFNHQSSGVSNADTYLYLKNTYYIIKGRIR